MESEKTQLESEKTQLESEKTQLESEKTQLEGEKTNLVRTYSELNQYKIKSNVMDSTVSNLKIECQQKGDQIENLISENKKLKTDNGVLAAQNKEFKIHIVYQNKIIKKQMILAKQENELQIDRVREIQNKEINSIIKILT